MKKGRSRVAPITERVAKMITIDHILTAKYLLARNVNTFYGRVIICVRELVKVAKTGNTEEYTLYAQGGNSYRLYHNTVSGRLSVAIGKTDLYTVEKATNNFVELITEGDTLIYADEERTVYANIIKHQEKYRRFIVQVLGSRHNLSTVIKKYGEPLYIKTHEQSQSARYS